MFIKLESIANVQKSINEVKSPLRVYDITVADNHNYIINCDNINVLSHNCLEFVVQEIIGPVVVKSQTTSLIPEIQIIRTNISWKVSRLWTYSISNMVNCEEKNNLIIEHVMQDLQEHPCIIIPTDRTEHVTSLCNLINERAVKENLTTPNTPIAYTFSGAMQSKVKKDVLAKVDKGICRVLVSMRSMIKQGIDLKIPTILYSIIPETATAEAGSPMFLQLSNRPCTPHLNKKQPIVKIFVDDTDLSIACFRSLFTKEIKPNLVASANNNFTVRYKLNDDQQKLAYDLLNTKSQSNNFNYFAQLNSHNKLN